MTVTGGGGGAAAETIEGTEYVLVATPHRSQAVPGTAWPPCSTRGGGGTLIPFDRISAHWHWAQRCDLWNDVGFGFVFLPADGFEAGGSASTAVGATRARPARPKPRPIQVRQRIGNSFPKSKPSPRGDLGAG
jgi:hypothetical protein